MKEFIQTLKELDFKYIPQEGCDAWSKVYKGFILFIVKAPNGMLLANITVRQLEISLPNIPDEYWVIEFDRENVCRKNNKPISMSNVNQDKITHYLTLRNKADMEIEAPVYRDWETDRKSTL